MTGENIYDLVIRGGQVADVVNETFSAVNIGIDGDRIARITEAGIDGRAEIDAEGMVVSPGFIDFHSHVDGNMYSAECMARQGGTTTIGGERNLNSHVFRRIYQEGFLINQGYAISHSFVLRNAAGVAPNEPATSQQVRAMANLAKQFLEQGAFGIAFGLELIPGTSYEELRGLSEVAAEYGRPILVHLRKDGLEALQCFDEILRVCEETGASAQILQLMYMVGINDAMENALGILDGARAKGLDITADTCLYDAFSVCIGTGVFDEGWEKEYGGASVTDLLISSGIHSGEYCDENLFRLLRREYPETLISAFVCNEDAILSALKKNYVYVSTNAADGPHYMNVGSPEISGTFPRLLGKYVRQENVLTLMEALRKITILPARRYGLTGTGSIEEGKAADIVVFDAESVIDHA
ncbi:MAG: amidohydrolase family protein, partial [Clostridiales Family XIII bacterium]|nr:amidohydrolase family protein [Clostridiales Family XIII bacterium]